LRTDLGCQKVPSVLTNGEENNGGKICRFRLCIIVYMIDKIILHLWDECNMKRSRHEILSKILKICLNGASKTRIVYQANLNFRTVNPYLQTLIKNNLIETCQGEQREHVMYKTTSEGANLQETMTQVNSILLHG